jgi:hypothetical protein
MEQQATYNGSAERTPDLRRLADYFPASDIEWKPGSVTKDKKKGLAMAYVTNRAIMDRLDSVCGPGGWRNEYTAGPAGGVLCGLSIRIGSEWVTKWDGAENTDFESVKGGLSNAMKRAAVQWGIGRYLYDMPSQWVPLNQYGKFEQEPKVPAKFLPDRSPQPPRANSGLGITPTPSLSAEDLNEIYVTAAKPKGVSPEAFRRMVDRARVEGSYAGDALLSAINRLT